MARDPLAAARARLIVALDVETQAKAVRLVKLFRHSPGYVKVGGRLFTAAGPEAVRELAARGQRVFLDLKFHDIPHIVAEACVNAARLGASLMTVHSSGGSKMMRAAREALEKFSRGRRRPRLLGVTLLTSLDAGEVRRIGFLRSLESNVVRLARLARASGCDGVIAAPTDVRALRRACGKDFLIITPGIKPQSGAKASDQARVGAAVDAIRAGADYVVVGRAVLAAPSPARALDELAEQVAAVLPLPSRWQYGR